MINIPDSIFPTNEQGQMVCPKCKRLVKECACPVFEPVKPAPKLGDFYVQLSKSGRSGKTVTVIRRLLFRGKALEDLTRELKKKTGSGGTCYTDEEGGVIEIQGDKREIVGQILGKKK